MDILTQSELRQLPTDRLRIMFSDARMVANDDYATEILSAWEHILKTNYPRKIDRR